MEEVEKCGRGPIGFCTRLYSPLLFFPSPISPPCLQCNVEGPQPSVATSVVIPVSYPKIYITLKTRDNWLSIRFKKCCLAGKQS